jgi:hypothetical protein
MQRTPVTKNKQKREDEDRDARNLRRSADRKDSVSKNVTSRRGKHSFVSDEDDYDVLHENVMSVSSMSNLHRQSPLRPTSSQSPVLSSGSTPK